MTENSYFGGILQGSSDDNRQADGNEVTDLDTGVIDLGEVERARVNDKDGVSSVHTCDDVFVRV